jgi:hypothetical protein
MAWNRHAGHCRTHDHSQSHHKTNKMPDSTSIANAKYIPDNSTYIGSHSLKSRTNKCTNTLTHVLSNYSPNTDPHIWSHPFERLPNPQPNLQAISQSNNPHVLSHVTNSFADIRANIRHIFSMFVEVQTKMWQLA